MAPTITRPIEDERTYEPDFTVIYTAEASADDYNIEIATDGGFTGTVINQEGVAALTWQIAPALDDDEYFMRVRGRVTGTYQSYSSTRAFRICEVAFPASGDRLGAEGCGALSAYWLRQHDEGTPSINIVTNGNDSGAGSLRAALDTAGPRIIMFEWAGTITLSTPMQIDDPYFYIAGETAFRNGGGGILYNEATIRIRTHDFVVKWIRGYIGDGGWSGTNFDTSSPVETINNPASNNDLARKVHDGIFYCCEWAWDIDSTFELWNNADTTTIDPMSNISVQYNLILEPLDQNSLSPTDRGRGFLLGDNQTNISHHHSAIFHSRERGPHAKAQNTGTLTVESINNLLYNVRQAYRIGAASDTQPTFHNIIGYTELVGNQGQDQEAVHFYDIATQTHTVYNTDNSATRSNGFLETGGNLIQPADPITFTGRVPVTIHPRLDGVANVLKYMGCYQNQTAQAVRMRSDWASGGSAGNHIADQADAPNSGFPTIDAMTSTNFDSTQGNSIPDEWAIKEGLNPATFDPFAIAPRSRYTWLEKYLHSLTDVETHNYRRRR